MIVDLEYSASFAPSGFTLERRFQPQTGITAVVGPNGSGKTASTIELVRWLLFGSKARRGKTDDYKNAKGKGTFLINGKQYTITRNSKRDDIVDDETGKILAVNPEAVNAKVIELLGYNLTVFDVCNASVQGGTQLFGKMKPGERKRMIDQVVGLTSNETVEKACRAEAATLRREVEALSKALVVPVGPDQPWGYQFSDELAQKLENAQEARRRYDNAVSKIIPVAEPIKPDYPKPAQVEIDLMQRHEDERRDIEREIERLSRFLQRARPYSPYTAEQLDAAEARLDKRRQIENAGPKPSVDAETIERTWQEWALYDVHVVGEEVTCPKCAHMFRTTGDAPLEPAYSKEFLRDQTKRIARWTGLTDELPEGLDLDAAEIKHGREAIAAEIASGEAQEALQRISAPEDRSAQLDVLRGRAAAWRAYLEAEETYKRQSAINSEAQEVLDNLPEPPTNEEIAALTTRLSSARVYESQWAAYDRARIEFEKQSAVIEDKRKLAEEFKKGGDALADARATIKAYLAPSLSRVASTLLYDMTNGALSGVVVDEDMEISVNGQSLDTLSGGGQTVANLALRIALGRVLVADTFPVFLGDEMDADIDAQRREAIAEALVGLKDHLKQIILITHRDIGIADHVLDLSNP